MKAFVIAAIAVLAMIQLMAEPGEAGITCGQVGGYLEACVPYLTKGGEPSGACCSGLKGLVGAAQTTADKRAACGCVKEAASSFADLKDDAAQALPGKCNVHMDIPISRNVNCQIIN